MTTNAPPMVRSNPIDRTVSWALDLGGDTYGDERERLRWYEGMTAAAQLQLIAMPWVATALVLIVGRPAVLPLAVIMAVMYLTTLMILVYVRRRGVDLRVPRWSRARTVFALLGGTPYVLFVASCVFVYRDEGPAVGSTTIGFVVGALIGVVAAVVGLVWDTRRRRAEETVVLPDVD